MKAQLIKRIVMLSTLATLSSARAAEDAPNSAAEKLKEKPPLDQIISKESVREKADVRNQIEKPGRPERPVIERPSRAEVKESVEEIKSNFRAKAEDYVKKQKEIVAELKGASAEEKKKAREKLKDLKEQWKNEQPNVREVVSDLKEKVDKEKEKGKGKGGGKPRD
jgi:hypothetical protein